MTTKQMRIEITNKFAGYKYVTVLNTWGPTNIEKIDLIEFYNQYCN